MVGNDLEEVNQFLEADLVNGVHLLIELLLHEQVIGSDLPIVLLVTELGLQNQNGIDVSAQLLQELLLV